MPLLLTPAEPLEPPPAHLLAASASASAVAEGAEPEGPPLWQAVAHGDAATVMQLLRGRADPNETYRSWTPLMKAWCRGGGVLGGRGAEGWGARNTYM